MSESSPAVLRVVLGRELRTQREAAGIGREDLAQRLGWHVTKLSRIEQGQATVKAAEVRDLLTLFDVDAETADRLTELGAAARRRGSYGKVPDWARQYLGLEADAAELSIYDTELVPGLFQTERYARAVVSTSVVVAPAEIEQVVEARMRRRTVLQRENPPRVDLVLGEAALWRGIGEPGVLCEQLEHLVELASVPQVTVQVLPFRAGEHAALSISFTLLTLDLAGSPATWVYLEDLTRADCLDGEQHIGVYQLVFDRLRTNALGQRETLTLLKERIAALR